jgi:hypothetical protein
LSYWDDFELAALNNTNLVAAMGGFESGKPSLWNAEGGTGATLTWATDQKRSGTHSLKIVKTGTGSTARWISGNQVRYWVDKIGKGVDVKLGAWVRTSGVNTSPANADAKWQLKFWFYDSAGAVIGGAPFALDVDQSVATKDWYADTNAVGSVILPKDAWKLQIAAEAGANATGTVWFDDFIFVGRGGWAGQNWNGFVDADSGWQYWIAPDGGNDGRSYFPGSGVTTEAARTGSSSLKIAALPGRPSGELVWFTETVPVPANSKGKKYVLSAWVKTGQIKKDSVFNASYALGFTWTWHSQGFKDAGGWNEVASGEYRFVLKDTSSNWTQYQVIIEVPENNVTAVSVRPRAFPLWTGLSYYDDFSVNALDPAIATSVEKEPTPVAGNVPVEFALLQNYPNPFNPSTTIEYQLPVRSAVKLEVFNVVGQKVVTLVDQEQNAGRWSVKWEARNDVGAKVSSGIYFYRLSTSTVVLSGKMLLVK